jgi:hypothetical protein
VLEGCSTRDEVVGDMEEYWMMRCGRVLGRYGALNEWKPHWEIRNEHPKRDGEVALSMP